MKRTGYLVAPLLLASLAIGCDAGSSPSSPNSQATESKLRVVHTVVNRAGKKVKNNDPPKAMPRPRANPNT